MWKSWLQSSDLKKQYPKLTTSPQMCTSAQQLASESRQHQKVAGVKKWLEF
jgi:hypothetical protein